jgi:hypothetical protein
LPRLFIEKKSVFFFPSTRFKDGGVEFILCRRFLPSQM